MYAIRSYYDKEVVVDAFTELAPRYESVVNDELNKFWGWSYEGFIKYLVDNTSFSEGEIILDIATGTGVIPRAVLQKNSGVKIIGIDITLAMLLQGKEKLGGLLIPPDFCINKLITPFSPGKLSTCLIRITSYNVCYTKLLRLHHR